MTNLTQLSPDDIATASQQLQARYDAFKARGLKLDLTRGKPSHAQLDLSSALLSLPGERDYLAEDGTDCRNYGGAPGSGGSPQVIFRIVGCSAGADSGQQQLQPGVDA